MSPVSLKYKVVPLLVLAIIFSLFSCSKTQAQNTNTETQAQKANPESDFQAKPIDSGKAVEITGYVGTSWTVVIPSKIQGLPVTTIGEYAFKDCTSLTSVTIPNSVTDIESNAFYYCTNLTSVTIPNGVTSIGDSTFEGCTSLTSVIIPNSVTTIGALAFVGCDSLTSVTIPDSVTSIGFAAFAVCYSLTNVTFQGTISADKLGYLDELDDTAFDGDLRAKYLAGGPGTYITTTPVVSVSEEWNPVWTKQ